MDPDLFPRITAFVGMFLALVILQLFQPAVWAQEVGEASPQRVSELQKKLQLDPEDIESMLALALEYSLQKQYSKAVDLYFKVLKLDPKNFHAYNNLGILYKKTGQYADSIYCYKQAEKLKPDSYWVPYNMGLAYEAMGRMQEAREAYGRALSLNPDFSQALQRLRDLEEPSKASPLPHPPGAQILVADSTTEAPKTVAVPPINQAPHAQPSRQAAGTAAVSTPAQQQPKKTSKAETSAPMIRTLRTGPAAVLYNEAMDALEKEDIQKAIESYVQCVLMERDFLAEPDNGLIQKGLELLNDRPNSMKDGLFYRAFLTAISKNLENALPDLKLYIEKNPKGPFVAEAKKLIDRYESDLAAAEKAKQELASAAEALAAAEAARKASAASFTPRPDDVALKTYTTDQILDEANRLSRENRTLDAIAVLRKGLEKEPDDLKLLMAVGNAYVDLLLQKDDQNAGLMARDLFAKVTRIAPPDSKEASIAADMIRELDARLK